MSAPQIGFPGSPTAQPQAYGGQPQPGAEWAQAAQYTMATGQLPPGITPEMIQGEMQAAQEKMAQHQEAQHSMAMQQVHGKYSTIIDGNNKMGESAKDFAKGIGKMAGDIGDTPVGKPIDGDPPKDPDTPTATTSTTASTSAVDTGTADKMNPANFQENMDKHMAYMPENPTTAFGGAQQSPIGGFPAMPPSPMGQMGQPQIGSMPTVPRDPMAHLGVQTGTLPTSSHFGMQTGAPQTSPYLGG